MPHFEDVCPWNKADCERRAALPRYSRVAVQKEIDRDKRIGKREARMIHALLKGRQKEDE